MAVVAALVLYVLSYGPVWALSWKYKLSGPANEMIATIYKPLGFVCKRLGMEDLMVNYCFWWGGIFDLQIYD